MKTLINITLAASLSALTAQGAEITTHSLFDSYTQDNNVAGSGDGVADGALNTSSFEQYIGAATRRERPFSILTSRQPMG